MLVDTVKNRLPSSDKGYTDLISLGSPSEMLAELMSGPAAILNFMGQKVIDAAKSIVTSVLQRGINELKKQIGSLSSNNEEIEKEEQESEYEILNFITKTPGAIRKHMAKIPDMCTPWNKGTLSVQLMDCSLFDHLAKMTNICEPWNLPKYFKKAADSFVECIQVRGFFALPTPYMNIKVDRACLPRYIQTPLKAILGAYNWYKESVKDCTNEAEEDKVACKLISNIHKIETKLRKVLTGNSLLELASNTSLLEDTEGNSDFKIFFELGVSVSIPDVLEGGTLFFTGSGGKRHGQGFFQLALGVRESENIVGGDDEGAEIGAMIGLGYWRGTSPDTRFQTQNGFEFSGSLDLATFGFPLGSGSFGVTLDILPDRKAPRGITITSALSLGTSMLQGKDISLLQEQRAMAESVQDAVDQLDGNDEKFTAAVAALSRSLARMDIAAHVSAAYPEPQALLQHDATNDFVPLVPEMNSLSSFMLCLTCQGNGDPHNGGVLIQWAEEPNRCLDVAGGGGSGTKVQIWTCGNGDHINQQFILPEDGLGKIKWAGNPDLCLDIAWGKTEWGTNLQVYDCKHGGHNFAIPESGEGTIVWSDHPSLCLDVDSGSVENGAKVQIWGCDKNHKNQKFQINR